MFGQAPPPAAHFKHHVKPVTSIEYASFLRILLHPSHASLCILVHISYASFSCRRMHPSCAYLCILMHVSCASFLCIRWSHHDSSVLAVAGSDNQVTRATVLEGSPCLLRGLWGHP